MSHQTRIGLIAVGIVGSLFAAVVCLVALAVSLGGNKPTEQANRGKVLGDASHNSTTRPNVSRMPEKPKKEQEKTNPSSRPELSPEVGSGDLNTKADQLPTPLPKAPRQPEIPEGKRNDRPELKDKARDEKKVYTSGKALLADMAKDAYPDGDAIEWAAARKWCESNVIGRRVEWTASVTDFSVRQARDDPEGDRGETFDVTLTTDTPSLRGGGFVFGRPFLLGKAECAVVIFGASIDAEGDIGSEDWAATIQYQRCTAGEAKKLRGFKGRKVAFSSIIDGREINSIGVEISGEKVSTPGLFGKDFAWLPIKLYAPVPSIDGFLPEACKPKTE
jgi:hypothetical protein